MDLVVARRHIALVVETRSSDWPSARRRAPPPATRARSRYRHPPLRPPRSRAIGLASSATILAAARLRLRSSSPAISGVNSICAPSPAARRRSIGNERSALAAGSMPEVICRSAIVVMAWRRQSPSSASSLPSRSSAASSSDPPMCDVVDEDLRNGASRPGLRSTISSRFGAAHGDVVFGVVHALAVEQPLGPDAEAAGHLGVDFDFGVLTKFPLKQRWIQCS